MKKIENDFRFGSTGVSTLVNYISNTDFFLSLFEVYSEEAFDLNFITYLTVILRLFRIWKTFILSFEWNIVKKMFFWYLSS